MFQADQHNKTDQKYPEAYPKGCTNNLFDHSKFVKLGLPALGEVPAKFCHQSSLFCSGKVSILVHNLWTDLLFTISMKAKLCAASCCVKSKFEYAVILFISCHISPTVCWTIPATVSHEFICSAPTQFSRQCRDNVFIGKRFLQSDPLANQTPLLNFWDNIA